MVKAILAYVPIYLMADPKFLSESQYETVTAVSKFQSYQLRNVHVHEDLSREQTFSSSGDNGQNIPRKFTLSYKEVDANHDLRQCPKSKLWKNNSMTSPTSFRGLASVKKK
jgi:hypothetical protein